MKSEKYEGIDGKSTCLKKKQKKTRVKPAFVFPMKVSKLLMGHTLKEKSPREENTLTKAIFLRKKIYFSHNAKFRQKFSIRIPEWDLREIRRSNSQKSWRKVNIWQIGQLQFESSHFLSKEKKEREIQDFTDVAVWTRRICKLLQEFLEPKFDPEMMTLITVTYVRILRKKIN